MITIVAALLAGATSLAMAQNGLPTGGQRPVAGGANGGGWGGGWYGGGWYASAPGYGYGYGYAAPVADLAAPAYGVRSPRLCGARTRVHGTAGLCSPGLHSTTTLRSPGSCLHSAASGVRVLCRAADI
jgi:hypothetical protein